MDFGRTGMRWNSQGPHGINDAAQWVEEAWLGWKELGQDQICGSHRKVGQGVEPPWVSPSKRFGRPSHSAQPGETIAP